MNISRSRYIIKQVYPEAEAASIVSWDSLRSVYDKYNLLADECNLITSHIQKKRLRSLAIGEKDVLYYNATAPRRKSVQTWVGKRVGTVIKTSFFKSHGFAPVKRVSITVRLWGMLFRGICSYENMQCMTVKRIA